MKSRALTSAFLLATASLCSGCATGTNIVIPESLRKPCESTVDVSTAETLADLSKAILAGDGDLRVCDARREAVVAIAESQNRRWFEFWR